MAAKLDVAALVMDHLGAGVIVSENEPTKRAKAFKRHWDMSRRAVLSAHKWGFATRQKELAQSTTETPKYGFQYAYEVTPDILKVWDQEDKDWPNRRHGNYIYSNASTLKVTVTIDVTDVGSFSQEFVDALAAHIAWKIAFQITVSMEKEKAMEDLYNTTLRTARFGNAVEMPSQYAETGSTWLDAAYRGVSDEPGTVR